MKNKRYKKPSPKRERELRKEVMKETQPKKKGNTVKKSTRRKNVSRDIPNGRTVQTRDEHFEGAGEYRKPGYENKGYYRRAVVVDSNRQNHLAVVVLTTKGEEVPGEKKATFRPYVETKDDKGNPITIGKKFKENKPQKDLSSKAVAKIKKVSFYNSHNALENRKKVRDMKGRQKK